MDNRMTLLKVKDIEQHIATNSSCLHPPLKDLVFTEGTFKGTTPLLLACHHGELDSVKHIVECWGVDVSTSAMHYIHFGTKIDKATPLFVAAHKGHVDIVNYLVGQGADVSAKTSNKTHLKYDGLTPLHGAIYRLLDPFDDSLSHLSKHSDRDKVNSIVRFLLESGANPSDTLSPLDGSPIWMRSSCGVVTLDDLIYHGLDLNQRDPSTGGTILHYWASLPRNNTEEESLTVVKLLVTEGADLKAKDNRGFTPIHLTSIIMNKYGEIRGPNLRVLDFLLKRNDVGRMEKIEALELAGAVILSDNQNASLFQKAFEYWRRALHHVIHHPSEYKIQSYLTGLRILSSKSWRATFQYELFFYWLAPDINRNLAPIKNRDTFVEQLNVILGLLETIPCFDPREKGLEKVAFITVEEMLLVLIRASPGILNIDIINTSLELVFILVIDHLTFTDVKKHMSCLFHRIVTILDRVPEETLNDDIMKTLFQLIDRDWCTENGRTLLYVACSSSKHKAVRLLLQAGSDPNAVDEDGNAPLHLLYRNSLRKELNDAIARLLLDFGVHFDRVNKCGKTAMDVWIERNQVLKIDATTGRSGLPDWCHEIVPKLSCLSARIVRSNKIPYSTKLPITLQHFVKIH